MLKKLEYYGIRGSALKWFDSYLSQRKQYVSYNGTQSNFRDVTCGVPQGSILGPVLFLIYINDIVHVSRVLFPILFADDSNVFLSGKSPDEMIDIMNTELDRLFIWLQANTLSLNIKKTHFMFFCPPKKKALFSKSLQILGQTIEQKQETKFLGVMLDSKLTWASHATYIAKKMAKGIGILSKAKKYLPKSCLITLYYSFIYPYLNYCLEVWGKTTDKVLDKIFKVQGRALRIINTSSRKTATTLLFDELQILPLKKIYQYKIATMMFKFSKNLLPEIFNTIFQTTNQIHDHWTRQEIHVPNITKPIRQKTVVYQGPTLHHYFSRRINTNCTINTYKKHLRTHLRQNTVNI